jgi:hypothetical protein
LQSSQGMPVQQNGRRCFDQCDCEYPASELSPKTIQKHVDNLWALGGEIIRDLNENPSLRRKNIEQILADAIDKEGGPLLSGMASEDQQRSFDSTCRKLSQFLTESAR